ncbi:MAG: helix-turn-helix domain-containing protein [Chloroflexi bacterium]|nr:helix-turn-helix domain-containing protein [Chloroflexota bacterium]
MILLAAEGKENQIIAREVGLSTRSVTLWRRRFAERRLPGG